MIWSLHRWTWRVASPLFIGCAPSGALNRCRIYVPARPLWGALTAELARHEADGVPAYREVGADIREHVRLSYLFPAEFADKDWWVWLPQYRDGDGLIWVRDGNDSALADRRFRRRLLWTRPGTAIDPDSDSALDGSLRETECLETHWRLDDGKPAGPVAMVGYVLFREGHDIESRLSAIGTVFIGGDTRYGLGRLDRVAMEPATTLFGANVDLDQNDPLVITNRPAAHALVSAGVMMCGDQEAIGGWDMTGQQQDRRLSGPTWTPGSRSLDEQDLVWKLLQSGMLQAAEGSP